MDKSRKLRHYLKKDYSQVVDFPVEIVGRDGVVRRYSFEASVRLYQRRITSAASRYEDGDLVEAEVYHCQRRIGQLRESYLHHYGWSSICRDSDLSAIASQFAGEVVAFLRRFYNEREEAEQVTVSWVDELDRGQIFFVFNEWTGERYLLYLFLLSDEDDAARAAFLELLRTVRGVRGDGVERLISFHHSADCALVLTGTEAPPHSEEAEARDLPGPLHAGLKSLEAGDQLQAMWLFERAITANPYQRRAHLAAAIAADALGQYESAEMHARMGLHYFPEDPALLYHLALALFREGRAREAGEALSRSLDRDDASFPARYLQGVLLLAEGRYREAAGAMERALDIARPEDAAAASALRALGFQYAARRWAGPMSAALLVGAALSFGGALSWLLLAAALLVTILGFGAYRFSGYRLLSGDGSPGVRPAPPENIQTEAGAPRRLV